MSATEFFSRTKEKLTLWKVSWLRGTIYAIMMFCSTFVLATENWSDEYIAKLHFPPWLFAVMVLFFKCSNAMFIAIIAFLDQTIQTLREELKNATNGNTNIGV